MDGLEIIRIGFYVGVAILAGSLPAAIGVMLIIGGIKAVWVRKTGGRE
jgi:hypothetical protein